ncbi:MAG: hypothetical protein AAF809_04725 [Bacteroidota bacterium]
MRWLFYFPKPRSSDGLLRRRPVWPRRLIRRSTTSYARRRLDHAEVGRVSYHVLLVVMLLFGCRFASLYPIFANYLALDLGLVYQRINPVRIEHGEWLEQRRHAQYVMLDEAGALVWDLPEATAQPERCPEFVPSWERLTAAQRPFAEMLCEEPRTILGVIADRSTPMDSVFSVLSDARAAGLQRVYFMGHSVRSKTPIATQP